MKKIVAILLVACYMLCAFGITFSFHHCRGELKYVNVHSEKKKTCCKGKKKMPKNCCKTVKVAFKKTEDKSSSFLSFKAKPASPEKDLCYYPNHYTVAVSRRQAVELSNYPLRPPPLRTAGLPLYIAHSVYRI